MRTVLTVKCCGLTFWIEENGRAYLTTSTSRWMRDARIANDNWWRRGA